MLTAKAKIPSLRASERGSDFDLSSLTSPHMGRLADNYEFSSHDQARCIRETLNCTMLSILILVVFASTVAFAVILGLRYVITTTNFYGQDQNCLASRITFDGWNFGYYCINCVEGFVRGHGGGCEFEH